MSNDIHDDNEALAPDSDPTAPGAQAPAGAAEAGIAPPPQPPPPRDWLFDEPAGDSSRPAARPTNKRAVIGAGVGAAVIALGAVLGINLADSGASNTSAAAANTIGAPSAQGTGGTGAPGAPGQMGPGAGGPGGGTGGTVDSVDGDTLTVTSDAGSTLTVSTSEDTTVAIAAEGSADDIAEGDSVIVMGTEDGDAIAAQRVIDRGDSADEASTDAGGPPGGMGGFASGEVSSVDGDTFTVSTSDGDLTVTMTGDTSVIVETPASLSDLESGDQVQIHGDTADDGTVTAERIISGDVDLGGPTGGPPMQGATGAATGQPPSGAPSDGTTGTGTGTAPSSGSTGATSTGGGTTTS